MKYSVKNLHKSFGNLKVLENINIDFEENKVTCILGPSGCGKTTLLNLIIGALKDYDGEIKGFEEENISFVFQEDRLIEWKTVKENMDFVLKGKLEEDTRKIIIEKYLKEVDMLEYKDYYPSKLSGGMRQRVSIARAFAYKSQLIIMDEPFKSLDIGTKNNAMDLFLNLLAKEKRTSILVTHDIDEAIMLGDNIITLTEKPTKVKNIVKNTTKTREGTLNKKDKLELKSIIIKDLV